jgi:hypothetical protein
MQRTTISLPEALARRLRILAAERRTSMAQLLREAAEQFVTGRPGTGAVEVRPAGSAPAVTPAEPEWHTGLMEGRSTGEVRVADGAAGAVALSRYAVAPPHPAERETFVPVPDHLLRWARTLAGNNGMSVEQFVRDAVEEKGVRMRPKPRSMGAFSSGYTDTSELSTEGTFEPPSPWRSS